MCHWIIHLDHGWCPVQQETQARGYKCLLTHWSAVNFPGHYYLLLLLLLLLGGGGGGGEKMSSRVTHTPWPPTRGISISSKHKCNRLSKLDILQWTKGNLKLIVNTHQWKEIQPTTREQGTGNNYTHMHCSRGNPMDLYIDSFPSTLTFCPPLTWVTWVSSAKCYSTFKLQVKVLLYWEKNDSNGRNFGLLLQMPHTEFAINFFFPKKTSPSTNHSPHAFEFDLERWGKERKKTLTF